MATPVGVTRAGTANVKNVPMLAAVVAIPIPSAVAPLPLSVKAGNYRWLRANSSPIGNLSNDAAIDPGSN